MNILVVSFQRIAQIAPLTALMSLIVGMLIGLASRTLAIRRGEVDTYGEANRIAWRHGILSGMYLFIAAMVGVALYIFKFF